MKTSSNFTNVFTYIFPLNVASIMLFTNELYFINKKKAGFRSSNTWSSDQSTFLLSNTKIKI